MEDNFIKNNWQTKKLGEVLKLEYGKPLPDFKRKTNGKYPVYGANGIKNRSDEFYFNKPSIIVGRKGSAGEITLTEKKFWPLDVTYFVTFNEKEYNLKFLYNLLLLLNLPKLAKGVKPGINRNEVYSIEIKIPNLDEQKRIVKILDETFEKLEKVKENTEKNLQNSIELFESNLNNIFVNPRKNWEEKSLKDVCNVIAGQSPEGKYYNELGKGLPFYQGKKEFTEKYIDEPTVWTSVVTKEAEKNDILMSVRAPVGPINFSTQKICIGRGLAAIRSGNDIDKNFLYYFLKFNENNLVSNKGAVFDSINKTQIESIKINLPDTIKEQEEIVKKLDKLSEKTKRLEKIYKKKLENIEELKKSVLQKAFTGKI